MYPPVSHDRDARPPTRPPTWRGLLAATALVVAVPFALWAAASLTASTLSFCGVGAVIVVTAHVVRRRNERQPAAVSGQIDRDRAP